MNHVVGAAQNAILQTDQHAAAGARVGIDSYQVAGAITHERTAPPFEIGEHQLSSLPSSHRLGRHWINDFNNAGILQEMKTRRALRTLDAQRPDLGHSAMVKDP